ncbi:MAG: sulfurtransferase [Gammaproteobacteria bacterium]|nr:MAG: sulfurtransferase [Gammaproteobacteria bacterium]
MDTLVSAEWLAQHLDDPDLVILDCTVTTIPHEDGGFHNVSGREDYDCGHIPGAGFADLKGELCDLNNPIEFSLPSPEQFCVTMGRLGVGDDSRVVLYDTNYTAWAARVWWMLRWVGFDNAAILDGGMQAWTAERRPLSTDTVMPPEKHLTPHPRPELIADRNEVFAAINDNAVYLIDTLPAAFYRGEANAYGRAGHIPGAINLCMLELLDKTGKFKSSQELQTLHTMDHNARNITYCGGGIMASANAFIMTRLGFTNVAVYTASLQEWAADPANPMVTGAD